MKKLVPAIALSAMLALTPVSAMGAAASPKNITGLGIVTSIGSSKDAAAATAGVAQVDSVIAAVTLDKDGKISKCTIDSAQTKVNFDAKGKVTSDKKAAIKTKLELADTYGMKKNSKIGKEWNEQAEAFAKWVIGKTPAEVKALKVKKVDDSHPAVPDVAELTSSVTITVGDFIEAVLKASEMPAQGTPTGTIKTGLGVVTSIGSSKDATDKADGVGQVDSVIAAVSVDEKGKIVSCIFDNAQTKVSFSAAGKVTANKSAAIQSKLELGEKYGMVKASAIKKEWFEQADAFSAYAVGKTIDELKSMKTTKKDDAHPAVPDVPELTSSVTVSVEGYIAAIEKAVKNAK